MDSGISADSNSGFEDSEGEVESDWKNWNQEVHELPNDEWIMDGEVPEGSQEDCDQQAMGAESCWSLTTEEEETSLNGFHEYESAADFDRNNLLESEICQSEPDNSACSSSSNSTVINQDDIQISEGSRVCIDAINDTLMSTYRLNYNPPVVQEPLMYWTEPEFAVIKEFVRLFPRVYPGLTKLKFAENPDPDYCKEKYAELEAEYNNSIAVLKNENTSGSNSNEPFQGRPDSSSNSDLSMTTEENQVDDSEPTEPLVPEPLCSTPPTEDSPPLDTTSETQHCPSPGYYSSNLHEATPDIIRPVPMVVTRQPQRSYPTYSHRPPAQQYGTFSVPQFTNQREHHHYYLPGLIQPQPYYCYVHRRPWHANTLNPYHGHGHYWIHKRHHYYDAEMATLDYNFSGSLRVRRQLHCYTSYAHYQLPSFPHNPFNYEPCTKKSYSRPVRRNKGKTVKVSSSSSASSTLSVEESGKVSEALPRSNNKPMNKAEINENLALQDQHHLENLYQINVAVASASGLWNTVNTSSSRKWIGLSVVLAILIGFSVGLHVACNSGCSDSDD